MCLSNIQSRVLVTFLCTILFFYIIVFAVIYKILFCNISKYISYVLCQEVQDEIIFLKEAWFLKMHLVHLK